MINIIRNSIILLILIFFTGCSQHYLMAPKMELKDNQLYPMVCSPDGAHIFGGKATETGIYPTESNIPLHKLLTIDLNDPKCPISIHGLNKLPLFYPLKYGTGGPTIQYSVISDSEIKIIYISDPKPDGEDACVKVEYFPELRLKLTQPVKNDDDIDWFTITLGGKETLDHQPDLCQNKNCPHYHKEPNTYLIASIPPIPIPNHEEIWWDFEGAYMLFYFWYCKGCNTVIASNRAT